MTIGYESSSNARVTSASRWITGFPRSTARGWLGTTPPDLVRLRLCRTDLTEPALRQQILTLQRRIDRLTALLRLALALRQSCRLRLVGTRLPRGVLKARILRAVDRARECLPLRGILRFLHLARVGFTPGADGSACRLDDQGSCPRTSPHRLTHNEIHAIQEMVTSPAYRHVPTGTLAVLVQRLGTVCASPSTWYALVRRHGWRRPRLRMHPAKPKVGVRTTRPDEMWHIDTTVIRLLDGTRAYLHAVIDNFSRRILAWQVADTFAAVNSVAVLLQVSQHATALGSSRAVRPDIRHAAVRLVAGSRVPWALSARR